MTLGTDPGDRYERNNAQTQKIHFPHSILPGQSPYFSDSMNSFAMERIEMNKRPFGESYGGGADELIAGNNDGPRKFRGGLFSFTFATIKVKKTD